MKTKIITNRKAFFAIFTLIFNFLFASYGEAGEQLEKRNGIFARIAENAQQRKLDRHQVPAPLLRQQAAKHPVTSSSTHPSCNPSCVKTRVVQRERIVYEDVVTVIKRPVFEVKQQVIPVYQPVFEVKQQVIPVYQTQVVHMNPCPPRTCPSQQVVYHQPHQRHYRPQCPPNYHQRPSYQQSRHHDRGGYANRGNSGPSVNQGVVFGNNQQFGSDGNSFNLGNFGGNRQNPNAGLAQAAIHQTLGNMGMLGRH